MKSYILFAHGARDPAWATPLQRLQWAIQQRLPTASVQLAYLEFMTPDLTTAIDEQVAAGAIEICVVPVFLSQGGHVKRDLPQILESARVRHPRIRIVLQGVIGEDPAVIDAMAKSIVEAPT